VISGRFENSGMIDIIDSQAKGEIDRVIAAERESYLASQIGG
jgi:hypothetical protein